jgi:hypothetical protein
MSSTRRSTRRSINQSRRVRRPNSDKVAAKVYVDEIKELRKTLKEIQTMYRDADKKVPKDFTKMNEAENALRVVDFPELPDDNISRKIKPTERWGIIATAKLWRRPLKDKRKMEEHVDKINAIFDFGDFKRTLNFLISPMQYDYHGIEVSQESGPPAIVPRLNYGQTRPDFSSPYGFPPDIGRGIPPNYMEQMSHSGTPPTYTRGGKRHKSRKYKRTSNYKRSNKYKRTRKYKRSNKI